MRAHPALGGLFQVQVEGLALGSRANRDHEALSGAFASGPHGVLVELGDVVDAEHREQLASVGGAFGAEQLGAAIERQLARDQLRLCDTNPVGPAQKL